MWFQVTEEKINVAREAYRPCAKRAAILFFVLSDLGGIDNMYQFSLDSYVTLFNLSINKSAENIRTDSVQNRVCPEIINAWPAPLSFLPQFLIQFAYSIYEERK